MKQGLHALVIDDEPQVVSFVADVLRSEGWSVSEVSNAEEAFKLLSEREWVLIFCDVVLGGTDGYAVLKRFSEKQPNARFVLMTGHATAAGALDATAFGAYEYLVKPFNVEDIRQIARNVREQHHIRSQPEMSGTATPPVGYTSELPLIGKSRKFIECLKMVGRVSGTNLPVFIIGESGTGKEVIARAIHQRSARADKPFVAVNCGAIPVELIESELFGHAKGAFTGAERERRGLWEEAAGGTIFLDEITETSPLFQVKLLRSLQEGEIRRVGSNQTVKVDVRVIAASNRNLDEEVKERRFRQDLMYRLNAVTIHLPPLRERVEDIPLLAEHFARLARPNDRQPIKFSPAVLNILKGYRWEGNIRELENVILHAASLSDNVIYPEHLPAHIERNSDQTSAFSTESSTLSDGTPVGLINEHELVPLSEMEVKYVHQVLAFTGGNKQAASRILGIDRKTLNRIINRVKSES